MERIAAAAIKHGDGRVFQLPPPKRHTDVMCLMIDQDSWYDEEKQTQGFVTDLGRFVTREEALPIAQDAGQIIRRCGGDHYMLTSEGVW